MMTRSYKKSPRKLGRVCRGSSWNKYYSHNCVAYRGHSLNLSKNVFGFRIVLKLE